MLHLLDGGTVSASPKSPSRERRSLIVSSDWYPASSRSHHTMVAKTRSLHTVLGAGGAGRQFMMRHFASPAKRNHHAPAVSGTSFVRPFAACSVPSSSPLYQSPCDYYDRTVNVNNSSVSGTAGILSCPRRSCRRRLRERHRRAKRKLSTLKGRGMKSIGCWESTRTSTGIAWFQSRMRLAMSGLEIGSISSAGSARRTSCRPIGGRC